MGGLMGQRVLEEGHSLTGYNRTRAKAQPLIDKGMKFAPTPRAVAEAADVVFSSVANSATLTVLISRSEEHTSELQSHLNLVCRLLLEKKKHKQTRNKLCCT